MRHFTSILWILFLQYSILSQNDELNYSKNHQKAELKKINAECLSQQVDSINFENSLLNIDPLSDCKNTYLHYRQDTFSNSIMYDISIWEREISTSKDEIILEWRLS